MGASPDRAWSRKEDQDGRSCCSRTSCVFVWGAPAVVFALVSIMCAALSVQTVLLSRESQGTAFQATATAAGAVLRSTFANHLRQLDAAARAIEVS